MRDAVTVYPFTSNAAVRSGVVRVTLAGELDLDTAPHVREAVTACLAKQPVSLCLDLSGISFCDCAGLSALLRARTSVLRAGVDLAVEGVGSQLARLLSLIGADDILAWGNAAMDTASAPHAPGTATTRREAEPAAVGEASLRDLLA
ncbi:STAS domain-containing protein [Streptomyces atroolivaceus]